jgi:hypothetical protein
VTEQGPWVKARKLEDGWDIAPAMNILDFITSVQAGEEDFGAVRALAEDSARDSGMAMGITITVGPRTFRRRQ